MEDETEKTDRSFTILKGFETYCIELISKGSASDICSSYDELILRADGLEKDRRAFIGKTVTVVIVRICSNLMFVRMCSYSVFATLE